MNKSEISEREKFEKFIQGRFRSTEKHLGGTTYRWTDVQLAWEAWERAIAESQAPQPEHSIKDECSHCGKPFGTMIVARGERRLHPTCAGIEDVELGGGEPSPAPDKSLHCAWHGTDTCGAPIIPDAYSYSGYSHFHRTDPAGQKIDWLHWASPIPHGMGAEETVRIFIPCVVCGKTGPGNENHIKYKKAGGHKFKCRSGAAQEVSPPSPEPCLDCAANDRDWAQIAQELGCESTREEMLKTIRKLGDTRELKAALKKFGQHNRNCNTRRPNVGDAPPCDCGFQRVYEGL